MTARNQAVALVAVACATAAAIVLVDRWFPDPRWASIAAKLALGLAALGYALGRPRVRGWLAFVSIEQWRAIERETPAQAPVRLDPHGRVLIVMLTCAVSLTVQEYFGSAGCADGQCTGWGYSHWFPDDGGEYWDLEGFAWWSGWRVFGYVVIPMIAIACTPGERIRDYYVSARGFFRHLWIYGVMFATFSPILIMASTADSFRETYPFYRMANRSAFDLWAWESLYVVQFVALEFFFRGFLLEGLRRVLGANAIFVMIVPYCMIHYGKPITETFGAIGAGLVLGTLAMRTRSIWGGVVIHSAVAITMDVLALRGVPGATDP